MYPGQAGRARPGSIQRFMTLMSTEQNVVLAGRQGKMSDDTFRIGHLGHVTKDDINGVMAALRKVLPEVGFKP